MRGYESSDRAAVRSICFATGYMGDPVDWQWADEESFADLFTGWYTDQEPGSARVAELDGRVVGYLLGCRDSRRVGTPGQLLARHLLARGLLVRPGTAPVLWRTLGDVTREVARGSGAPAPFLDDRWPAHLHIDLLPEARSQGVGEALVAAWLADLASDGVAGCHLETWAENDGAIAFFHHMGFERRGAPTPMPGLRSPEGSRHHTQLMVQTLDGDPTSHPGHRSRSQPDPDDHPPPGDGPGPPTERDARAP